MNTTRNQPRVFLFNTKRSEHKRGLTRKCGAGAKLEQGWPHQICAVQPGQESFGCSSGDMSGLRTLTVSGAQAEGQMDVWSSGDVQ